MENYILNLDKNELRALSVALFKIKNDNSDIELANFMGSSPFIETAQRKICCLLNNISQEEYQSDLKYRLTTSTYNFKQVKKHIVRSKKWNEYSDEIKMKIIVCFASPLFVDQECLFDLINYGNEQHSINK